MRVINVLDSLTIGENTAITIDSDGKDFRNGIGILDEKGKPFVVLSVGTARVDPNHIKESLNAITLLIEGKFESKKIFL